VDVVKKVQRPRPGMILQPRVEEWVGGIPLYSSPQLQYDDEGSGAIGWIDAGTLCYVLAVTRPRGSYTALRVLGPEAVGWTASAYLQEVEG
jgi:hypothetical protein